MLDRLADLPDADQPALIDHRKMAEFAGGHPLHDITDRLALVTGLDGARHASAHRLLERRGAARGERTNDVTFGNDAADAPIGTEDERRTDAFIGEQPCSFG